MAPGTGTSITVYGRLAVLEALADAGVPQGSVAVAFNQPGPGAADLIDGDRPVTEVRLETLSASLPALSPGSAG